MNHVYSDPAHFQGTQVLVATLFFPMQLYCDFAGYSNIAFVSHAGYAPDLALAWCILEFSSDRTALGTFHDAIGHPQEQQSKKERRTGHRLRGDLEPAPYGPTNDRLLLFVRICRGVLFRSGSISNAYGIWENLFHNPGFSRSAFLMKEFRSYEMLLAIVAIIVLQAVEWLDHRHHFFATFTQQPQWLQYATLYALILGVLMFGEFGHQPFIYFQF